MTPKNAAVFVFYALVLPSAGAAIVCTTTTVSGFFNAASGGFTDQFHPAYTLNPATGLWETMIVAPSANPTVIFAVPPAPAGTSYLYSDLTDLEFTIGFEYAGFYGNSTESPIDIDVVYDTQASTSVDTGTDMSTFNSLTISPGGLLPNGQGVHRPPFSIGLDGADVIGFNNDGTTPVGLGAVNLVSNYSASDGLTSYGGGHHIHLGLRYTATLKEYFDDGAPMTPEPSRAILLLLGLCGILGQRRR